MRFCSAHFVELEDLTRRQRERVRKPLPDGVVARPLRRCAKDVEEARGPLLGAHEHKVRTVSRGEGGLVDEPWAHQAIACREHRDLGLVVQETGFGGVPLPAPMPHEIGACVLSALGFRNLTVCLLYTSPSPRD